MNVNSNRDAAKQTLKNIENIYSFVDAKSEDFPPGWAYANLDKLRNISTGVAFSSRDFVESGIPVIKIGNVQDGYLTKKNLSFISSLPDKFRTNREVALDDICISLTGNIGRTALVDEYFVGAYINQRVALINSSDADEDTVIQKYLYYYLQAEDFKNYCLKHSKGSAQLNISIPKIKKYYIYFPAIEEQRRIVSLVEASFIKLDEASEKIIRYINSSSMRIESLLSLGVSGELTKKWRKNNPNISSEQLLKEVSKTGNNSRQKFSFEKNNSLPDSWRSGKLGNLMYFAGRVGWKGLKASEYTKEGPLFLSVYNLNYGDVVGYEQVNYISEERYEESPEIMVKNGDVLLAKDGAGIGKLGYIEGLQEEATINSSILLIRPGKVMLTKYLYYQLSGPKLQRIVRERITGSTTPHLFQRDIKGFELSIPPLEEQAVIVRRLDELISKEREAVTLAQSSLHHIEVLKKGILDRAFKGQLGTSRPEDETALEMLAHHFADEYD